MSEAKSGDTVRIHYTGTLDDGSVFDSSRERDPLEFTLGTGQVIAGFDDAVTGMTVGDRETTTIPSEKAYGAHNPDNQQPFPRDKFPPGMTIEVGARLQLQTPEGAPMMVTIAEVTEDHVILDGNHPLAGKDLTFDIELVEIV